MGTITKALGLLNHFSSEDAEIGLAKFVRLSQADKATVRRHLVELEENGFLEQNPATRKYRLGPAILRLAAVRERSFPMRSVLGPVVDDMATRLGELVHAALLQGDMMSTVCHADPKVHGTRVIFDDSEMLPLHATASGLAILAFGPEDATDYAIAQDRLSYAPNTVIAKSDLLHLVRRTREQGYSFADQTFTSDIQSYGMPFFGPDAVAIGTIAVPVPKARMTDDLRDDIIRELRRGCAAVTRSLGGDLPPNFPTG
ncbi:IclR family transcriptional regulator [Maritimibacter sp. UBA3975]|uniref:IclR family transcriptional regulator n=1 Tax=Maritimibacter sp. UBA3975 TaxID=1946833 RepID=UPI000C0AAFC6|nr:IclR family transcriptional regulator [Maritimibacter sp. UBA3975]MAM61283.1 IclR family transcriptional regulator [Maritimibacter sp.]|tara:strand:+ start:7560 stop:8330 length:771 start_codon:yes stop_codon:yes gene_type:complete